MFENSPLAELAVGRSTVRQRILALLICEEPARLHLREIQRRVGTSPGTASRELARLVAAGVIDRESEGVQVYFRASNSPVGAMLRQLFLLQEKLPPPALAAVPAPLNLERHRRARQTRPERPATPEVTPVLEVAAGLASVRNEPAAQPSGTGPQIERLISFEIPTEPSAADGALQPARVFGAPARRNAEPDAPVSAPIEAGIDASEPPAVPHPADAAAAVPEERSVAAADPLGLLVGARFAADLRPLYESRLKGVYLFGARAQSPAAEDADVELIVVLDAVERYGDELERTSPSVARLSLELGLVVSRVFVAQSSWSSAPGLVAVMTTGSDAGA